ncbi:MAG: ferritin [Eubacteriales bacterium]|nr:ferritin [Eubacteriales bacterium]MDD4105731.1 ferritin [Eubacteriales bacterium]MDD4710957.1 ferritin [Eubacteriales bacterium]NLO15472.1 ferritin [Clostridiales bacterium]
MIKKEVTKLLNEQINKELFSAYLYLEFVNYLTEKGLMGYAHWYRVQAQEERDHAMLIYDFLHYHGAKVELDAIDKPVLKADSVMDVLKEGLKHEQFVTASINNIYDLAKQNKDFLTQRFLDWFINEQGEEEANANELILKNEMFGGDARSLYLLDQELMARTYAPPSVQIG